MKTIITLIITLLLTGCNHNDHLIDHIENYNKNEKLNNEIFDKHLLLLLKHSEAIIDLDKRLKKLETNK